MVGVLRTLLFVAESMAKTAKISEAYLTVVLLDYEDDLGISGNLAKTVIRSCATFVSHKCSHETISARWFLWSALEAILNNVPSWSRRRRWTSWLWEVTLSARMSCAMRRWILGWVALCEIVCEMHIAHLLLILSLPDSEQTGCFMVGVAICKISGI
jgi:hypothetical protein